MVSVPQRLLKLPFVEVLHRSNDMLVIEKRVEQSLYERPTFLSMHAFSMVSCGEQVISTSAGNNIRIRAGEVGVLQKGMYNITDLLSATSKAFETRIVFFTDELIKQNHKLQKLNADHIAFPKRLEGITPFSISSFKDNLTLLEHLLQLLQQSNASLKADELLAGLLVRPKVSLRDFMLDHFDKPLSIVDYAYLTGQSERSFRRNFRTRFGESPKKWLKRKRLEKAKRLLTSTNLQVNEIAQEVGYSSSSFFIETFKKAFGTTPGSLALTANT